MRKVSLFIAMSPDGYIADRKGGVDWLKGQGHDEETFDAYAEFTPSIDTVMMGWNTYHQIVTELSPNDWIYHEFTTYVFNHRIQPSSRQIRFVSEKIKELVRRLKEKPGKGIWICGGANLVHQFMEEDLIDLYYITIIPTILGSGIRLFSGATGRVDLRLMKTRSYNGITDLIYERR